MKRLLLLGFVLVAPLHAQEGAELEVRSAIEQFFEAFHERDSELLHGMAAREVVLQTIKSAKEGGAEVVTQDFDAFVNSIASIPDTVKFMELITDYRIRVDGPLAHAWTPYEFWLNEEFSHCGVNSFQLVKLEGRWKIISLIDTRRKEDCL